MTCDVLILNTAVLDLRSQDFAFVDRLVGPGGLAKCTVADMPPYTQEQIGRWIGRGGATAGGPGNSAPLMARTGLAVAVGANLGQGAFGGLDIQGRTFTDMLTGAGVDMSATVVHPRLPTGTTFIHETAGEERGGIAYFPNANDDFDFEQFKPHVLRFKPRIVFYMYSGLSARGDARGGRDLADFMRWCRAQGCIALADSHTLCSNPRELIRSGQAVEAYRLLDPLLPELDIFFTSADECKMIANTLAGPRDWGAYPDEENLAHFLSFAVARFARAPRRPRLFGVTMSRGAMACYVTAWGEVIGPRLVLSRFMGGGVVDLVGAGDSFRAGLIAYVARNAEEFRGGTLDIEEAVQMGNLTASLYVKAPLHNRYAAISPYEELLKEVRRAT